MLMCGAPASLSKRRLANPETGGDRATLCLDLPRIIG
jgi:hypothetical protein